MLHKLILAACLVVIGVMPTVQAAPEPPDCSYFVANAIYQGEATGYITFPETAKQAGPHWQCLITLGSPFAKRKSVNGKERRLQWRLPYNATCRDQVTSDKLGLSGWLRVAQDQQKYRRCRITNGGMHVGGTQLKSRVRGAYAQKRSFKLQTDPSNGGNVSKWIIRADRLENIRYLDDDLVQ